MSKYIVKEILKESRFDDCFNLVDATTNIATGDLVHYDATNNLIAAQGAADDGSTFLGIQEVAIVAGTQKSVYGNAVEDGSAPKLHVLGPIHGVIARLVLKTGDALDAGAKVYPDGASGTRHVTSVAGAGPLIAIGVYQGATIASATAGQEIEVLLKAVY